jgi:hypothetical protein
MRHHDYREYDSEKWIMHQAIYNFYYFTKTKASWKVTLVWCLVAGIMYLNKQDQSATQKTTSSVQQVQKQGDAQTKLLQQKADACKTLLCAYLRNPE